MPVMAMDHIWPIVECSKQFHDRFLEECEPLAIIHKAINTAFAFKIASMLDEEIGDPVFIHPHHFNDPLGIVDIHRIFAKIGQLMTIIVIDLFIQWYDHTAMGPIAGQCLRQTAHDIRQSAHLDEW